VTGWPTERWLMRKTVIGSDIAFAGRLSPRDKPSGVADRNIHAPLWSGPQTGGLCHRILCTPGGGPGHAQESTMKKRPFAGSVAEFGADREAA